MKTTLYQIENDYQDLMDDIEEAEGVLTPEMEDALLINSDQLQQKSISYLEVIKTKEAFNLNVDNEIKRLQALKKRNNNLIDRLENSLLSAVSLFGEFAVGTLTFGARKSESITVKDINSLPSEFKTVKVTETANKADLKAAIKGGKEINGVTLNVNVNLKIK